MPPWAQIDRLSIAAVGGQRKALRATDCASSSLYGVTSATKD